MDVAEKLSAPLTQRLNELITDSNELKDFLGCSIQAVNQYKLGTSRPSLENLCKIADFYGVSTDYLLGRTTVRTSAVDKREMCDYSGLTESALEYLHSLHDSPDYLRIISAILEDKTFQAILPDIPNLEKVKLAVELDRFGVLPPVKEHWTKEGYLVGTYDYFDMLEFRIAQNLKLVISNITNPPAEEV
ncbi:XRE family transcriptional regulator [Pseudoflavonifractor sp. 524-17]|nr:XRE family transcriptional regulator [Pseudoflavonifractor sp. 524-17]